MTNRLSTSPITKGIQKLARQIDAKSETTQVPVQPGEECSPGSCFDNVRAVVRRRGGSTQYGWRMREEPGVLPKRSSMPFGVHRKVFWWT